MSRVYINIRSIMRNLSKSKIIACRQYSKRLWLEIHKPELRDDSASQMAFDIGNEVGKAARQAFDLDGIGTLVDVETLGHSAAIEESKRLLAEGDGPIFEAGISAVGVLRWRMIEVKSNPSNSSNPQGFRENSEIPLFIRDK